ncbi:MAG: hypothetical protein AAGA48_20370 [Myxococcota bacterium]
MTPDDLDTRLAELPRSVAPSRDLWPDIAAAVEPPTTRWWRWAPPVGGLLAAAAVLWGFLSAPPAPLSPPDWAVQMRLANEALEATLMARDDLDSAARAEIERNLGVIDQAIAECEAALAEHPDHPDVAKALSLAWSSRIDVLAGVIGTHP